MCLFSDGLVPPGFSPQLTPTRQYATGVPMPTADDHHCHCRVLPELAVVVIANFLSETGKLGRE
jgi:hypothetical protein